MLIETAVRYAAGSSSTGLVRKNNEDSAYVGRWLYAVADGLGGHVAGEIASATVIDSLRSCDVHVATADLAETLGRAVGEANGRLLRKEEQDPALAGMGTTLTAMLWSGEHAAVAHIGDSRAYLLREGRLLQITEDHTLGKLIADLAGSARLAPVLVRYLDGRPDRSPDLTLRKGRPGDRYLLCSDGLSGVVAPEIMRQVLVSARSADQAVDQLVALASEGGGPDNITVIVVDLREAEASPKPVQPRMLGAAADAGL
ncbi:MAG TPA: protein phosphatase 2C domain-containing protein [Streptosporangiaceae bacterium]|jgi:protein phosphatase|nr:protein phosphatase 2C domain-containing protein [Streptosporangiaceae bacterium]